MLKRNVSVAVAAALALSLAACGSSPASSAASSEAVSSEAVSSEAASSEAAAAPAAGEFDDDQDITVNSREAGSGTRDGFESIVDVKDSCKYAQELTATGAVISAVEANPLAIGYASLSAVGDTVKAVTVGGVECSEETVKDGSYEVQRPFVFVTNDSVTLSAQAQAFFDFAASTDAADLIRTAGAVPVNE